MAVKIFEPRTPGRRQMTGIDYRSVLTRQEPEKRLTFGRHRSAGRNAQGRITTRHKGGGAKRLWREIDFLMEKKDIPGRVLSVEYDPNRTSFIGLVAYRDGEKRYLVLPSGVRPGEEIVASAEAPLKKGNRLPLRHIPPGSQIYNLEIYPGSGSRLVRSAGAFAELLAQDPPYAHVKLPSGEIRKFPDGAWASMGQVSNEEHSLVVLGKAGRSRLMGIRPTVRGSAMNPVDHPYGGGEGRAPRGTRRPKNRWGRGTRGVKTRKRKKYSSRLILAKRKK